MTTISAPRVSSVPRVNAGTVTTPFERTLLRAAAALDLFVAARLESRSGFAHRSAVAAQTAFAGTRRSAEAYRAIGMLPR